jgi:RNA-directed DNA polymerase
MTHGHGKSDSVVVAGKSVNKAEQLAAEPMERRAGAKGNVDQQSTRRAQNRESVSQALERIRQAARQRKRERFTSLLHHVSIDLLRLAFFELKRNAAAGVDGLTWQDYEADIEPKLMDLHTRATGEHIGHCHHDGSIYLSRMVDSARLLSQRLRTRLSNGQWQRC